MGSKKPTVPLLAVSNISLLEPGNAALQPLSFEQRQGQKLAVAGGSGAGKSTLLQLIAGLVQPSSGEIRLNGRRVRGPAETLVAGHPGVAYLSQRSELPHSLRVEQVLRYANQRPEAEAQALYELCHIAHLGQRRTDQLSGGEQQRVALARLLLAAPALLLLDEPFSNLDRSHKQTLKSIIENLGKQLNITCLLVSHDPADVLPWADEILVLRQGRLVQQGPPSLIYQQPADAYTAALFGDFSPLKGAAVQALAPAARLRPGQALLLRPEDFVIGPPVADTPTGRVRAVRYFGGYCEVEVKLLRSVFRVQTDCVTWAVGAEVGVGVKSGRGWVVG